ncbi:DctP family TRAP transporter solute-binding subunit [Anaerotignum faecicola]|nr:DctP family TRAP transporter solute-binding subunit [Anaerotignum faecicola]
MKKRVLGIVLTTVLALSSFAGCVGGTSSETEQTNAESSADGGTSGEGADGIEYPELKIKMSTTVSDQSNASITANLFSDIVEERSGGKIKISVYPSDQLSGGNMSKGVEMIGQGAIDCAFEPVDVLAVLDESLLALSLPWTFESYEDAQANLEGTGGEYIKKALNAQGIEYLGAIHNGFRQLTNNKQEVTKPEDLKNMKLRVPGGDVFVEFFKEFGADPVAMSFSELFTALQQGTVDGQENGFDLIVTNKFYEVQKFTTAWNYSYGAFALVFNKATFDSYDDNTKALLQEAAAEACKVGCQNVVDTEEEKKQLVVDYAENKLTELTPEQIEVFKSELDDYYARMKEKYGEEACTAFGIE